MARTSTRLHVWRGEDRWLPANAISTDEHLPHHLANWSSISSSGDGLVLIAVSPSGGGLYLSTNGGRTWKISLFNHILRAGAVSGNGKVAISLGINGEAYISSLKSGRWGKVVWRPIYCSAFANVDIARHDKTGSPVLGWQALAMSHDGTHIIMAAGGRFNAPGNIYISGDGGQSFHVSSSVGVASWWDVAVSRNGTHLAAVSNPGYVYTSIKNGGVVWTVHKRLGLQYWTSVAMSADGKVVAAAVEDGRIYVSSSSGRYGTMIDFFTSTITLTFIIINLCVMTFQLI